MPSVGSGEQGFYTYNLLSLTAGGPGLILDDNKFTLCSSACPSIYISWQARYSNTLGSVCSTTDLTVYTSLGSSFTSGDTVYTDTALTTPLLGYDYISELASGTVWNINSGTGIIGTSTGNTC